MERDLLGELKPVCIKDLYQLMQDTLFISQYPLPRMENGPAIEKPVPVWSGELARYLNTICQWLTNVNCVLGWLKGVWMGQAVWSASGVLLWEMCTCVHDSLSPKGAKSQQGNAHVALLSSPGYNNESNCLFALVHIMRLLLPLFLAHSQRQASAALHTKLPPTSNQNTLLHRI